MTTDKIAVVELDDGIRGVVKRMGAHASTVVYMERGYRYEVVVPNEEFEILGYINIGYQEI